MYTTVTAPLKILATAICLSILSWATPSQAQQQPESQLPSSIEQLTPSQIQQYQRQIQQREPLLYLFLQLQQSQLPNLQQQAEEQLRQILQQPPSLQQRLLQQQAQDGKLRLDKF